MYILKRLRDEILSEKSEEKCLITDDAEIKVDISSINISKRKIYEKVRFFALNR